MKSNKMHKISDTELHQKYIIENLSLVELAEYFDAPLGTLRKRLAASNIFKTQKMAGINVAKTRKRKNAEGVVYKKHSYEQLLVAQKNSVKVRKSNTDLRLEKEDITYETLYHWYLEENISLTELGAKFGRTKAQMRKLLTRFQIPAKTPSQILTAKKAGQFKMQKDPLRVQKHVEKTQSTIQKRYGNKWYRQNSSSQEKKIVGWISESFPDLEISVGDYSVIKNPNTKAALQLDIFLPTVGVAIEFNGEYWHDRNLYEGDKVNQTSYSREMLKEKLCAEKDIRLIHIWSSDMNADEDIVKYRVIDTIREEAP